MLAFLGSPQFDETGRLEHVAHYSAQMHKSSSLSGSEVTKKIVKKGYPTNLINILYKND